MGTWSHGALRAWVCSCWSSHTASEELLAHSEGTVHKRIKFACPARAGDAGAVDADVLQCRYMQGKADSHAAMWESG